MLTYKYTLNIDALTFTLQPGEKEEFNFDTIMALPQQGNAYVFGPNCLLRRNPDRIEKYYLYTFDVWINSRKVATLSTNSRPPLPTAAVSLRFENWVFYTAPGWLFYYKQIRDNLNLFVSTISTLHIAFDRNAKMLEEVTYYYINSTLLKYSPNPLQYASAITRLKAKLDEGTYTFGKASGNNGNGKEVTLYNKSQELKDNGKKQYIVEFHSINGLNTSERVERIEAKFTNKYLSKYDISLFDLNNQHKLLALFIKAVENVFSFKSLTETTWSANRNKVNIYTHLFDTNVLRKTAAAPLLLKEKQETQQSDNRQRIALKAAVTSWIETGSETVASYVREFLATTPQPRKGSATWSDLVKLYGHQYKGIPTAESAQRQDGIDSLLQPSIVAQTPANKYGLHNENAIAKPVEQQDLIAELARISPAGWLTPQVREYSE